MLSEKKPETKKIHIFYYSIYMKYPDQAKPWGKEVDQWFLGVDGRGEWGVTDKAHRISFSADENALR